VRDAPESVHVELPLEAGEVIVPKVLREDVGDKVFCFGGEGHRGSSSIDRFKGGEKG